MSKRPDDHPITAKLDAIRVRLMADPTKEELERMKLHLDTLEKWDRLVVAMLPSHDHDHMDDHDHT